jgi:hypothetical protein
VLIWSNERVVHHVVGICVGAPQNRHSAGRGMPHQLAEGARVSSARFAHQLGVGGCAGRLGCQPLPALRVLSPLTTPPDAVEVRTRALVVRGQASRSGVAQPLMGLTAHMISSRAHKEVEVGARVGLL